MVRKFSIILEDSLFDKVEAARKDRPRTDFISEVIAGYFVTPGSPGYHPASPEEVIEFLQSEVLFLRGQLSEMDRLLHQEQSLHLQTQKQLVPSEEEIKKRSWWEFWK